MNIIYIYLSARLRYQKKKIRNKKLQKNTHVKGTKIFLKIKKEKSENILTNNRSTAPNNKKRGWLVSTLYESSLQ